MPRAFTHEEATEIFARGGYELLEPYHGAEVPTKVRCVVCGEINHARLDNVRHRGAGCPFCDGQRLRPGELEAALAEEGLVRVGEYTNNKTRFKVWCRQHEQYAMLRFDNFRTRGNTGCAGHEWDARSQARRIPDEEAESLMRSLGYEPVVPYPGANEPWLCRCLDVNCQKKSTPSLTDAKYGHGCFHCYHRRSGEQRATPAEEAETVLRLAGIEPLEAFPGAGDRHWMVRCDECGHEWNTTLSRVKHAGSGCPNCRQGWIKLDQPARVYLITHIDAGAAKVGICNTDSKRLWHHIRNGWTVREAWEVEDGQAAWNIERTILDWWRHELKLDQAMEPDWMPQGGWSETVSVADLGGLAETMWRIEELVAR